MELAYKGETTTPSRCGRMDQCCAFGRVPVFMTFDGDELKTEVVRAGATFFLVIVDLCANKNTHEILAKLSEGYPHVSQDSKAKEVQEGVQHFLGPLNKALLRRGRQALEAGDAAELGKVMAEFQALFDQYLQPACPSELTAPVLHRVLAHPSLQPLIFGAKGVGSQGDGSAQFLCRSLEDQEKVCDIIRDDLGMVPLCLTIGEESAVSTQSGAVASTVNARGGVESEAAAEKQRE
uniref:GHMP kinase C-terminal domain-containing protein n=1 Tax=Rhizochromulina marina TaxID=1034831 RepID=A0A7S2SKR4_9STRA|mmetsp:Transcript_31619/g.91916  ORF Transcript_31619/g.91916 Transcript_31619/m.91916 type:complete len:236 (+) Transcript_31619:599-1306(+)